jgi:uncharacterized membrane protein YedE/YeeE
MDIGQGAGLSGASGVRPFLPALLAGALARQDTGLDFSGTSFSFLESPWFLLAVFALGVLAYIRDRRSQAEPAARPGEARAKLQSGRSMPDPFDAAMLLLGMVLGALLFAGSLADHGHASWPGILAGVACAALGYFALASLFAGARRRLSGSGGPLTLLGVYADVVALVLAGLSILFPPLAFVALAAFLVLIVRSRGERSQKYEGLRSLR